jgi:hypothetical protein
VTKLRIPEITDTDKLTAAMAYAACLWYILPVKRGTKDPGSVVGKSWHTKSSRDPKQITAWFAGADHDIALHCGRSGAVVFDVDDPDRLPDALRKHLDTAPYQSTRSDVPGRGHYIFAQPPGRTIGNGTGRLGGAWGEVRGLNGVIIAEPSSHAGVHDGVLIEIKDETGARPITRYIHGSLRTNEITNYGRHGIDPSKNSNEFTNSDTSHIVSKFVDDSPRETGSELHDSLNSLLRSPGNKTDTHSDPPGRITDSTHHTTGTEPALVDSHAAAPQRPAGAPTDRTLGMTPRVQQILAKVGNTRRVPGFELPTGPDRCNECGFHTPTQGHSEDCHQGAVPA